MRRFSLLMLCLTPAGNGDLFAESYSDHTFKRWVEVSDAVVIARRIVPAKRTPKPGERVTCRVTAVLKKDAALKIGEKIAFTYYKRKPWRPQMATGTLLLLLGDREKRGDTTTPLSWEPHADASSSLAGYLRSAPGTRLTPAKRLAYFSRHLNHKEAPVALDAWHEFDKLYEYEHQAAIKFAEKMKPDLIRSKLTNGKLPSKYIRLCGILLGLCGTDKDAVVLQRQVVRLPNQYLPDRDGLMIGYLLLTGERGLDILDRTKLATKWVVDRTGKPVLKKDGKRIPLPWWESYSALSAVDDLGECFPAHIRRKRILRSIRLPLQNPEINELVISYLSRWKDWSVQDRLMKSYEEKNFVKPSTKRAIVRYFLLCERDLPKGKPAKLPAHVRIARKHLRKLRRIDPKTVKQAERFFFE